MELRVNTIKSTLPITALSSVRKHIVRALSALTPSNLWHTSVMWLDQFGKPIRQTNSTILHDGHVFQVIVLVLWCVIVLEGSRVGHGCRSRVLYASWINWMASKYYCRVDAACDTLGYKARLTCGLGFDLQPSSRPSRHFNIQKSIGISVVPLWSQLELFCKTTSLRPEDYCTYMNKHDDNSTQQCCVR